MLHACHESIHKLDHRSFEDSKEESKFTKWRNIIGFWILGLACNYPLVIMLSAAFDVIHQISGYSETLIDHDYDSCTRYNGSYTGRELCEKAGTWVCTCSYACVCVCTQGSSLVRL